jgi:hypothetical protein
MELEPSQTEFNPQPDRRPKMEEPPPVMLVTVADAELTTLAGLERELDAFYVGILRFEREPSETGIVYRAENFRLRLRLIERPEPREDYRALGIVIPSLPEMMVRLHDAEIEFVRTRGLNVGEEWLDVLDPAGNRLELIENKQVM